MNVLYEKNYKQFMLFGVHFVYLFLIYDYCFI